MKLSVVVPAYNAEKYIEKCLLSIKEQTFTDFECIVINDGSADNTLAAASCVVDGDSRFRIISRENGGISSARNAGIDAARGEYIAFVDSDDWLSADMFSKMLGDEKTPLADLIICDYYCSSTSGDTARSALFEQRDFFEGADFSNFVLNTAVGLTGSQLAHPERSDRLTSVWAKIYKTEIINRANVRYVDFSTVPSECQLFNIHYMLACDSALYVREPLYYYRRNTSGSLTKKYRASLMDMWEYYLSLTRSCLQDRFYNPATREAFNNSITFSVIQLGGNAIRQAKVSDRLAEIKAFLGNPVYRDAFRTMDFRYLPLHWRVFFSLAKHRMVFGFYLITKSMRFIMNRRKR